MSTNGPRSENPSPVVAPKRLPWWPLAWTILAPLPAQLVGSGFNIAYNLRNVEPLLAGEPMRRRFLLTALVFNGLVYPCALVLWFSLFRSMRRWLATDSSAVHERAQRRLIHLPWWIAAIAGGGWLLCIPVFLGALASLEGELHPHLYFHLPISFLVSALISVAQSVLLVDLSSQALLYDRVFLDETPAAVCDAKPLTIWGRGVLLVIAGGVCPIVSLLLLLHAPQPSLDSLRGFALFVGGVGVLFGVVTAGLCARAIIVPLAHLRRAAQAIAAGERFVRIPIQRADEFGPVIDEFHHMAGELREKETLRQTFGLHVGERAARLLLRQDPELLGVEETITVVFVDIRGFTSRSARSKPSEIVSLLNEFHSAMVEEVEDRWGGLVNKFLGDGFLALFGVAGEPERHADAALGAAHGMLERLADLNASLTARGEEPIRIGIGLHTGPAIVGSIGSPRRQEFTAIGDTINVAARIESLTKDLSVPLLLSAATRGELVEANASSLRSLGPQTLRGREEPLVVYTLSDPAA